MWNDGRLVATETIHEYLAEGNIPGARCYTLEL